MDATHSNDYFMTHYNSYQHSKITHEQNVSKFSMHYHSSASGPNYCLLLQQITGGRSIIFVQNYLYYA